MIENEASANVLRKNNFQMVVHAAEEDWGYEKLTTADKWIQCWKEPDGISSKLLIFSP